MTVLVNNLRIFLEVRVSLRIYTLVLATYLICAVEKNDGSI